MVYLLNPLNGIYLQFLEPNLPAVLESHHLATLSHSNNDQGIQSARKLMSIAKTYGFNSLSEAVFVCIKALHWPQKEAIGLVCSLIKSPNLFEVQKVLKRGSKFKAFAVKSVHNMVKDEMSAVISNPKLSMSSSKISPNAIEGFSILTIDNKYAKSAPILQSIVRASATSIDISSHSSC